MAEEGYDDVSRWQEAQLDNFQRLRDKGFVDEVINGDQEVDFLATVILSMVSG